MGKISGDLFGTYSGKLGLTVGRKVHGVCFTSKYNGNPRNPRTSLQMDNRERFKTLAQLSSAFMGASKIGLKATAKSYGPLVSTFAAFVKANQGAVSVMGGEAEVDYGSLLCAKGSLAPAGFGNAVFTNPQEVSVTYATTSDMPSSDAQDKVYMFLYQPDTKQAILSASSLRTTGTLAVHVPASWVGLTVHCYGFAIGDGRDTKGLVSDSSYIGTGIIG